MNKLISGTVFFLALFLIAANLNAQSTATWKEKDAFHTVMSQTFHPMESGDFKPIRKRSNEMYMAAKNWSKSTIPANLENPKEISKMLKNLVKESKSLDNKIKTGCTNEYITKKLTGLHDIFHDLVGACSGEHH
jgi:hypothetical protein